MPSGLTLRSFRLAAVLAGSLLLTAPGCDQSAGPKLDNSTNSFIAAQQALEAGETDKALQLLTASIDARPTPWAYYQRARLYVDAGQDKAAQADCQAGLQLDSGNTNLQWLSRELKKPKGKRFKGRNAEPPRVAK